LNDFLHRLDSKTLAGLLEATRNAILIVSSEGKLVYANRAAQDLLGYSQEELMQMDLLDRIAPPYREWVAERIQQNRSAQPEIFEIALVRKDGSWRHVRYSTLYLEMEGQMYEAAIIHDLTEAPQTLRRFEAHSADANEYATQAAFEVARLASKSLEALY
jgi:PAS domain S-box-containing protein